MKHAMLFTVNTNFKILQYFIDLFDDARYDFFILVDKKVKYPNEQIISVEPKNSNIYFLPRLNICWCGYSQIDAYLQLIEVSSKGSYDYYHFFQGSDLPLKTKDEVDAFFDKHKGKEFINIYLDTAVGKFRCGHYHLFVNNRYYRNNFILKALDYSCVKIQQFFRIKRNSEAEFYRGSALTSLTDGCVKYILSRKEEIKSRFKFSLAADEVFLQTLIVQSVFFENIYKFEESCNANCRFIDWERSDKNSPYTFVEDDYYDLINLEEDILFARKFNEKIDFKIVQRIVDYLYNR